MYVRKELLVVHDKLPLFFCISESNHICKVKGTVGDGINRGTCGEGLICFVDGSCREPGKYFLISNMN